MSSGGGSKGNGFVATDGIPAAARKMVQSLKEIVNLPEQEIYFTLKECGMDPSEAVQRLLSQDSFHEVKSKRDKKKEMKELHESRTRTNNNTFGQGVHGTSDRGPLHSFIRNLNVFGGNRNMALQKGDGMCGPPASSNIGSSSNVNKISAIISDNVFTENLYGVNGNAGDSSLYSQPSSGYQHGWMGIPGDFSMADIVKMGKPQGKLSGTSTTAGNASHASHQFTSDASKSGASATHLPLELDQGLQSSQDFHQQALDNTYESGTSSNKHASCDGWPSDGQHNPGTTSTILDTSGSAISYSDTSKPTLVDEIQLHQSLSDESPEPEKNSESDTSPEQYISSESISEGEIDEHSFEGEDANLEISSAAATLQNPSLEKHGLAGSTIAGNPAVIIPRHLQVTNADCSHLSFGSFGSRVSTSLPGSLQAKTQHSSIENITVDDVSPLDHSNVRNRHYYDNDELKSQINEDVVSRGGMQTISEISATSESEVIGDIAMNRTRELQYELPSLSDHGTSTSTQDSDAAFGHPQTNLQMHNLSSLSNLMQPYTSSLPSGLLAPTLPLRHLDLPFSSFLTTPSMSTKHNVESSNGRPTVPMQELKPIAFSDLQPQALQSSISTTIPIGHSVPLPQQLPLHPYSQATLPLAPFTNVISYPFLPQSYTYLPSAAFPQAYAANDPFHQSPAAVHNTGLKYAFPQYRSSISLATLPQPAAVVSGYGNFSGLTNITGNLSMNPSSTTATSATSVLSEALSSQYKEGTHYLSSLQQNESSPMWVHGGNSRTVSPLLPNTFHGFQAQDQLISSFRQAQQPSHYAQMGYLNFIQNQERQQNSNETNLNGSHVNSSQQSHQLWQHGY